MPTTLEAIQGLSQCVDALIKAKAGGDDANRVLQEANAQKEALISTLQEEKEAGEEELQKINDALTTLFQTAKSATAEGGGQAAQVESVVAATPDPIQGTSATTENSATFSTGESSPSAATPT